ncbi:unnamed protein product [Amaranthus hypochondriacus]
MAVPVSAYKEVINISYNGSSGEAYFDGFTIQVFREIVKGLSNPPTFNLVPYARKDGTINVSYDSMAQAVANKEYDGIVGDLTIRYDRTQWVDFTQPYTETGVTMMVSTKQEPRKSSGIRVMPLIKALVYTVFGVCFISAIIFWLIEFRNDKNRHFSHTSLGSNPNNPLGHRVNQDEYWRRETMRAITQTRLVVVVCFLVLVFITSCYAASFTSLLTTQRPNTPIKTLDDLIRRNQNVGIMKGSFIQRLLIEKGLPENQIRLFSTEVEMVNMLSKENGVGGVVAVIDETLYLKLFISKNCNKGYALVPSFDLPSEGIGFAFQKGSKWQSVVSNEILKLMDAGTLLNIQQKTLGDLETCQGESNYEYDDGVDPNVFDLDTLWIMIAGAIGVSILVIILYIIYFGTTCDTIRRRIAYPCYLFPYHQERKN